MLRSAIMMWLVACTFVASAATATPPADSVAVPGGYASLEALRHYVQARTDEEAGDLSAAFTEYARALTLDPHAPAVARHLSDLTARQGDAARSLEFANRALDEDAHDARALWLRGSAEFNLGRSEDALVSLRAAVDADSTDEEVLLSLARVAEQLDRVDIVQDAYRRIVDLDEEDSEAWFQLAAADARLDRFPDAKQALARSVQLNPGRPGVFFLQGWIEESLGNAAAAIDLYRRHLGIHRDDQVTRRRLVNLLANHKQYPEAWRESQIVARSRQGDIEAQLVEADLALYAGHVAEGRASLEQLRRAHAEDVDVQGRIMGTLMRHDRKSEGVELAENWARRHPGHADGEMLAARANALAERETAAIDHARRAVTLQPDSLSTSVLLGRIEQGQRRWGAAESVWVDVLRKFPGAGFTALDLAFCREQLGDIRGAERAVRDLLRVEPDNPRALNSLGYLLADHNEELPEARRMIERAVEMEPDNGAFLDSLGWVYFRLGRLPEARKALERAVTLTDGDPIVREHLGDVYKEMRFNDLAREQYRLSLAGDRTNTRVRAKLGDSR
ncbi:MAG TPA: tetratricopeptide repeat protein [Candidatus Saccharimonadaceae bacterium]|nr:tetratricopeptide repeat protein [Candidatus Saccharimonadaceae bacterium]